MSPLEDAAEDGFAAERFDPPAVRADFPALFVVFEASAVAPVELAVVVDVFTDFSAVCFADFFTDFAADFFADFLPDAFVDFGLPAGCVLDFRVAADFFGVSLVEALLLEEAALAAVFLPDVFLAGVGPALAPVSAFFFSVFPLVFVFLEAVLDPVGLG